MAYANRAGLESLVGRQRELGRIVAALEEAAGGRAVTLTIHGDAGVGKTRLVEELGAQAEQRGMGTLVGRCYEAADTPALWPWSHVVERYVRDSDQPPLGADIEPFVAPIAEMFPILRPHSEPTDRPSPLDPERARFRIFDCMARLVTAAARARPLAIVLEDVHAADAWSLQLFEFLARECADAPLLLTATYRDPDVDAGLVRLLSSLAGLPRYQDLHVAGLDAQDSVRLLEQAGGAAVSADLLRTIVHRSEGNPLFALQLLRAVTDGGPPSQTANTTQWGDGDIPRSIRAVIHRRLECLSVPCLHALTRAAAIGREFDIHELEHVTRCARGDLLAWLDEALARRVVLVADGFERFRFAHGLIRECLYDRIGTVERGELHRGIGRALESLHSTEIERYLPEIADHFFRGALAGDADRALAYAVRAARVAVRRYAYEEAGKHYERALTAWRLAGRDDDAERCELLIDIGWTAQWAGDTGAAAARFADAAEAARTLRERGDPRGHELLARAVLGTATRWGVMGVFDAPFAALLEDALAGLSGDSALRARLLGHLAVAYYWSDATERRDALSAEAVEICRRIGDAEALAHALFARHFAILSPDRIEEQLTLAEEAVRLGDAHGDSEMALTGRFWRFLDRFSLGDTDAARHDIAEYARIADEIRQPFFQSTATAVRAMLATLEGRLDEGQDLALRAFELGRRGQSRNAEHYFGIQMLMLARLRGTEELVLEPARTFIERAPGIPAWRAALAAIFAALGRHAEAARELDALVGNDSIALPRDANFLVACALLAEVCVALERKPQAKTLYHIMRPYASRHVIVARGAGYVGMVAHFLGLLATTIGHADRADAWFADALASYEKMGAHPFIARALIERAAAAVRSRTQVRAEGPSDPVRAMLVRGLEIARRVGMPRCVATAAQLLESVPAVAATPGASAPRTDDYVFQCEGACWMLVYEGGIARVKDSKGLHYLRELLRAPGRDVHVCDLLAVIASDHRGNGRGVPTSDAGPMLDQRAKTEYRQRIAILRDEIEEAEALNDIGRAATARQELEQLADQLRGGFGLGGRDRRAIDMVQRARLNVTRAIRSVIGKVAIAHPHLARHLDASVVTGRMCRYEPRPERPIVWRR